MAKCKACGAPIDYIRTPAGSYMPVDPKPFYIEPAPEGSEVLVNKGGEVVRCTITEPGAVYDPRRVAYRSHFATCPEGERMRRAKGVAAARQALEAKAAAAAKERAEQEAQGQQLSFIDVAARKDWR